MDSASEMMVISDSGSKSNFSVFDLKNGALILSYKEGNCNSKGLSLVGNEYFLSASKDKPIIYAWTVSKRQFEMCPMVVPGVVACLAVNDIGDYCVAGIKNSMYLWEVSSGRLLNVVEFHSQPITCIKFSSCGTYIISGGKDGLVLVWLFSTIVDVSLNCGIKPYYVWMDHSGDVTDIHVGKLGCYARVATASVDKTCRIYELESGNLLTTICTDSEITAIAMDNTEYFLMLGCCDGKIYKMNLFATRDEVKHVSSETKSAFTGHRRAITSLSVSTFGKYLLSGSEDGYAILWEIKTLSSLMKLPFEGPVTNAFISLFPTVLKNDGPYIPKIPIGTFKRDYDEDSPLFIISRIGNKNLSLMHAETPDNYFDSSILMNAMDKQNTLTKSKASPQELDAVNKQLYSYALCDLVNLLPSTEDE